MYPENTKEMKDRKKLRILLTAAVVITAVLLFGGSEELSDSFASAESGESFGRMNESETGAERSEETEAPAALYVYVYGAVRSPGLYVLPEGSRVYDAVAAAGGYEEEADPASLNPARSVADGEMLYVAVIGEEASERAASEAGDGRIDLNKAGKEELMSLQGIGEQKAAAVIAYREKNGAFRSTEDIMLVSGIGEALYERIRDSIKVTD